MFEGYPKAIAYIISSEFFERFTYYGLRAILSLFLSYKLGYDESSSIYIFHIFAAFVYFFPLVGSIIADAWLGKYKTILYLSIIYALGGIFLTSSAIPAFGIPTKLFVWIGLLLIAVGTGGIKPCVSAFGGDQFKLPEQLQAFAVYFQLFYAAINAGSLIAALITPILREDVECFGEDDCYSLAFGVPALLTIVSIAIFESGRGIYVCNEPTGHLRKTIKCIFYAIRKRIKAGNGEPKEHWMDHASRRYGSQLVKEIKVFLRILVLFIPVPMFWALYDQQASRWVFQATRTDPRIGSMRLKPEQLQFLNPLLIIIFIPLFKFVIYPVLKFCDITRPLQKMGIGAMLIMASFIVAGLIEDTQYETKLGPIQPGPEESTLILFNGYPCDFSYQLNDDEHVWIRKFSKYTLTLPENEIPIFEWTPTRPTENCDPILFSVKETAAGQIGTYLIRPPNEKERERNADMRTIVQRFEMEFQRTKSLMPDVSIVHANETIRSVRFEQDSQIVGVELELTKSNIAVNRQLPKSGRFRVIINNETDLGEFKFDFAQNSMLILGYDNKEEPLMRQIVMVKPFTMNILIMVPQYVLATAGEIMFSITGLEFSYSQAPKSMKTILQACWLLTVAIGNVIVVLVTSIRLFDNPANESYLFALLMFLDIILFIVLAKMYTPMEVSYDSDSELAYLSGRGKPKIVPISEDNNAGDHQEDEEEVEVKV